MTYINKMARRAGAFDWSSLSTPDALLVTSIVGTYGRKPDLIIAPDGEPYLYRWHVIPRNEKANVYLHIQVADDAGRDMHDHPWDNQSVILAGGYLELWPADPCGTVRRDGDVIQRWADERHRLEMIPGVPYCISLFSTGPKIRDWGFYTPSGWRPHTEVTDGSGNYSTKKLETV